MPLRRNRFPQVRAQINAAAARGVSRAADFMVDLARQLVPVDTGALRQSIRREPRQPDLTVIVKAGGGGVGYAKYVEYGTSRSPAQPYMTPAARAIDVRKEVAAELRKVR